MLRPYIAFLRANSDMFAWTRSDMSGVPREVIEHHLALCPNARPLEQVLRNPNATDHVAGWGIELQPFELEFDTTRVIKGRALADFIGMDGHT